MTDEQTEETVSYTLDEVRAEVQSRAEEEGLDPESLPRTNAYKWFSRMPAHEAAMKYTVLEGLKQQHNPETDEGKKALEQIGREQAATWASFDPITVRRRADMPLNPKFQVEFIFHGDDEILVYALPKDGSAIEFGSRYRLSKAQANYGVEQILIDTWMDEVVSEMSDLDKEVNAVENAAIEERGAVIAYIKGLAKREPEYSLSVLADDLEAELHLEDQEEDEEEEEEAEEEQETPEAPESPGVTKAAAQPSAEA